MTCGEKLTPSLSAQELASSESCLPFSMTFRSPRGDLLPESQLRMSMHSAGGVWVEGCGRNLFMDCAPLLDLGDSEVRKNGVHATFILSTSLLKMIQRDIQLVLVLIGRTGIDQTKKQVLHSIPWNTSSRGQYLSRLYMSINCKFNSWEGQQN